MCAKISRHIIFALFLMVRHSLLGLAVEPVSGSSYSRHLTPTVLDVPRQGQTDKIVTLELFFPRLNQPLPFTAGIRVARPQEAGPPSADMLRHQKQGKSDAFKYKS